MTGVPPLSEATVGYGTTLGIGDGADPEVFGIVGEVFSLTPPNLSRDMVDVTHMQSYNRWREFVPGLRDGGEAQIQLNLIPGSSGAADLLYRFNLDVIGNYEITFPDATVWGFSAYCVGFSSEAPIDGKITATVRFKITGIPAFMVV